MKFTILICVLFFNVHAVSAAACKQNPSQLIAHYQIKQTSMNGKPHHETMTLTRFNNQVGHFYHEKNYGDWWSKASNKYLMLARYFPAFNKAIEYQHDEINMKSSAITWQQQWQLLTDKFIEKMIHKGTENKGCTAVNILTLNENDTEYTLRWLPKLRLIEQLTISSNGQLLTSWQLLNLNGKPADAEQYVKKVLAYQTIDYADIGDNEADPFLAKMIHQGFKEGAVAEHSH